MQHNVIMREGQTNKENQKSTKQQLGLKHIIQHRSIFVHRGNLQKRFLVVVKVLHACLFNVLKDTLIFVTAKNIVYVSVLYQYYLKLKVSF